MARVGWHGRLHPEAVEEYSQKHREIWPEMVEMLKEAGLRNYAIFVHGTDVFGFYECDDLEAAQRHKAAADVSRRWSEHMAGLFASDGTTPMTEVMYIE